MRILHVITGLAAGGAEAMLLKLLSWTAGDVQSAVVSLSQDERAVEPAIRDLGIPVYCLGLRRVFPNPLALPALRRIVRNFRPQIIQGWMPHGNVLASLAGRWAGKAAIVWNIRQALYDISYERWFTRAVIRLGARLSSGPAAIVYNSRTSVAQHEAFGYKPAHRIVIPNGFDCQLFRPDENAREKVRRELGLARDAVLIGLVARYHAMKDHANFLRAAGLVARQHVNTYFLLVGSGVTQDQAALVKIVADQQLQERVFLMGERPDVPRMTASLDIACCSSWTESFPNTVGEAMACGVPCVVTNVGDSAYVIGDTGVCTPPRDYCAFAEGMNRLLNGGIDYRRRLGSTARERIEREFSMAAVARQYESLYDQLSGTAR